MGSSTFKSWILATRPKTLWAGIAPVIMGTALAAGDGGFHALSAVVAVVGAILIQIGANLANDYFDFIKGADTEERLGPVRAVQAGLISPAAMKAAFIATFAIAFVLGLYLVWRGGEAILIVGILSILFGVLYTGGPYPLGYNGLGDVFAFIFFGPVAVAGTYYVQTLSFSWLPVVAGCAPGLFSAAILTVNNLRDIQTDRAAGKRTLAVRFGQTFARSEYIGSVVLACSIPILLLFIADPRPLSLCSLIALFIAIPAMRNVGAKEPGAHLNAVLAQTGVLLLLHSVLFSIGWLI